MNDAERVAAFQAAAAAIQAEIAAETDWLEYPADIGPRTYNAAALQARKDRAKWRLDSAVELADAAIYFALQHEVSKP